MTFQLGAALLDACVLAVLSDNEAYGYILTQQVREVIEISESTLYPVLRRLQKENLVSTYDKPIQGRNRRYYVITEHGRGKYVEYISEWEKYKKKVDGILLGGVKNEES